MPHFKTKHLKLPTLPLKVSHKTGEFAFLEFLISKNNPNFGLLHTRFTPNSQAPQDFFLEIKNMESQTEMLVRFDKYSRIAPIEIIKNALAILMRFQDSITTHNLNPSNISSEHKLPFIKDINAFLDFQNLIKTKSTESQTQFQEIWLEIGFGSGRHLLHNAQNHSKILHIGLEIHHPSLEQVARQIGLQRLNNILILAYDARIFLELLPSNVLDKIFVHFPVPWDKKPHRRIFSQAFLTQCARVLQQNGHLQLRTDSLEYFTFAKNLAQSFANDFKVESQTNTQETITSKYEARWLRENKDIFNLELYALQTSKEQSLDFAFDFYNSTLNLANFKRIKCVENGYFLHTEDLFIGKETSIMRATLGDFNYPETRYIVQDAHLHYFRSNPLPTHNNHKAHNLLVELIAHDFKGRQ